MKKTYTQHKLTDAQLVRLSQVVNNRCTHTGMPMCALERKGLVVWNAQPFPKVRKSGIHYCVSATQEGIEALAQARREGW